MMNIENDVDARPQEAILDIEHFGFFFSASSFLSVELFNPGFDFVHVEINCQGMSFCD